SGACSSSRATRSAAARTAITAASSTAAATARTAVVERLPAVLRLDVLRDEWEPLVLHDLHDLIARVRIERRGIRQVIALRRSVRRVQIEAHLRVVVDPQLREC